MKPSVQQSREPLFRRSVQPACVSLETEYTRHRCNRPLAGASGQPARSPQRTKNHALAWSHCSPCNGPCPASQGFSASQILRPLTLCCSACGTALLAMLIACTNTDACAVIGGTFVAQKIGNRGKILTRILVPESPLRLGRCGGFSHATPSTRRSSEVGHAKRPEIRNGRSGPSSLHAQPRNVCGLRFR